MPAGFAAVLPKPVPPKSDDVVVAGVDPNCAPKGVATKTKQKQFFFISNKI